MFFKRVYWRRIATLLGFVLVPWAVVEGALLAWPAGASAGGGRASWLAWLAPGLAAGLGAVAGGLFWQWRLGRVEDALHAACQAMALGEPSPLGDPPARLDELGRLGLSIQVLREALWEQQELYRHFFEAAPDMFLSVTSAQGLILDANPAFCRAVGFLKPEVAGQPAERFLSLDVGWAEALNREGELLTGHVHAAGGEIRVEASFSLEKGHTGVPWLAGIILRDVTVRNILHGELLRKSLALEKALEEIKSVDRLKDQFLTTLSHELKTPLVSLKGFLQMLLQGRATPEEAQSYLEVCWRNLGKLEKQINNLLDLARLSQAKEQYAMTPVDLVQLLRMEAQNFRPLAQEHRVTIEALLPAEKEVLVLGNPDKLVQLVDNLLQNAVKYNVEGGTVKLALSRQDGKAVLEVTDSGIGMARENMARIFNRFYRANLSGTGRIEGLGIGLSLVQEIVILHEGDIKVESEPGKGTVFRVVFKDLP
ncbi:MAG: PAS domain-containing sensor histidine kinase [Deltaproteobacteria bacterium]|nr:PAS domain-containing sensor histidine kinase [Deltaproteobacteria bacterium]